jgi:subtilase family serine protease
MALPARSRIGSAARLPSGSRRLGAVPGDLPLRLTVALEPTDPEALESLATAVSTPGSPEYGEYLDVPEFAGRFGATPAQIETVAAALRADGLEVGAAAADRLTLPVTGSAEQVERAFATSLSEVRLPGGRTAYANQTPPTLRAAVAPFVQGVVGLDDLALPRPQVAKPPASATAGAALPAAATAAPQVATGGPQPCLEAQDLHFLGGLTADEVAAAYQFSGLYGSGDQGAGQTIALIELQGYAPNDISAYQACYGTNVPVVPVNVDGGPTLSLDDIEPALDIEQVIGLAPQASVLVYQAPNTSTSEADVIGAIVSEDRAKVISSSWAICEQFSDPALLNLENSLLQEAAVQGQSFFASSGDTGAQGCLRADEEEESLAVQDPSSQPFATGVGGTSLLAGVPPTETVWNDGSPEAGATGGGTSIGWPMPSYQLTAPASLGVVGSSSHLCAPTTYCREVPDVSADADPNTGYIIHADGEWEIIAGTSAAAPLWAALTALTNADSSCRGRTIGFANPALYSIAATAYSANFHDITAASPFSGLATNNVLGAGPYPVTPGYDMTTGLGTPIAPTLAASLCAVASPQYTVSVANPGALRSTTKIPVSVQMSGSDSGGIGVTYTASGLPPGLAIDANSGAITGVPSQVGIWTVTVTASDGFTNSGSTQFSWGIARLQTVRVSHVKLRGIGTRRPNLSFKISVGKSSPRLATIKVNLPHGLGFSHAKRTLYAGAQIHAKHGKKGRPRLKVHHSALLIHLAQPAQKATVTLHWPALRASAKLAKRVEPHGKKKVKLKLVIGATDTAGNGSRFAVSTRAR